MSRLWPLSENNLLLSKKSKASKTLKKLVHVMEWPLPPELIRQVVSYINAPPSGPHKQQSRQKGLSRYATVNRDLQAIIEELTFSTLHLKTAKRLEEFKSLNLDSRRKSCVRRIDLRVELESYNVAARARFETDEEQARNNKIFTEAITSALQILAFWPNNERRIALSIEAWSPSDWGAIADRKANIQRRREARFDRTSDLLHRRFERAYLRWNGSLGSLSIPIIREIHVHGLSTGRLIQPASCALIASNLPNLRYIHLYLNDECKRDKLLRRSNRNDFATLFDIWPQEVQEFQLHFNYDAPFNHDFPPDDITENHSDRLSSHIREFSQQLTDIRIDQAVIGKELFWPLSPEVHDVKLPFWPHLVSFIVEFSPVTPSGEWMFERDPDEEDDKIFSEDSDSEGEWPECVRTVREDRPGGYLRSKIVPGVFNELHASAGRAAKRMPKLQYMSLETRCGLGMHSFTFEVKHGVAKAIWDDTHGLYPEDGVLQIWQEVASQRTGLGLDIKYERSWGRGAIPSGDAT